MTVYVVQRPARKDRVTGQWVDKYDLSDAERFGDLEFLLRPGSVPLEQLDDAHSTLSRVLSDFDSEEDHLLLIGDPSMIGLCCMLAGRTGRPVSVLKYDRMRNSYVSYWLNPS